MELRLRLGNDEKALVAYTKFHQQKDMIRLTLRVERAEANRTWVQFAESVLDRLLPLYFRYCKNVGLIPFDEFLDKVFKEAEVEKIVNVMINRERAEKTARFW